MKGNFLSVFVMDKKKQKVLISTKQKKCISMENNRFYRNQHFFLFSKRHKKEKTFFHKCRFLEGENRRKIAVQCTKWSLSLQRSKRKREKYIENVIVVHDDVQKLAWKLCIFVWFSVRINAKYVMSIQKWWVHEKLLIDRIDFIFFFVVVFGGISWADGYLMSVCLTLYSCLRQ